MSKAMLWDYVKSLCSDVEQNYYIDPEYFDSFHVKRGLRNADGTGVMAGLTKIGSVQGYVIEDGEPEPAEGSLVYRGIDIGDIIEPHVTAGTFGYEEVAYLLLIGELPTESRLARFNEVLTSARKLPEGFTENVILKGPSRDVMNKLSQSVLALYAYDEYPEELSVKNIVRQSIELIGRFPVLVARSYTAKRHYFDNDSLYLHQPKPELSVAENFLRLIRPDATFTPEEAHLLDLMLMLHAEHGGGNNSTFAARVLSSSGTDTFSCISAAVGSLKGPKHGGANAKVMEMFENIKENVRDPKDDDELSAYLANILDGKANDGSGLVYGMGHAIYTLSDPRTVMIKKYAKNLAHIKGMEGDLALMESIERLTPPLFYERRGKKKVISANIDMYSGLIYKMLDIPEELYTPLFAVSRVSGWCAHRLEEILTAGRIIRPAYRATLRHQEYRDIESR
ncbi:citrate synthase [Oscillospiraceae bacterium OttesenSCG-928-G22]|nr:citrate synthase [Oscillospiraceae bacterium OttesenSCG-928-G22]